MSIYDMFFDQGESIQNKMYGMTLGIVTNIEDPENLGRIKVKLSLRDDKENETNWARVIVPFAGSDMGAYSIPDVGDEVVICFLGGQLEKPVVVGGVWSKKVKPPEKNEDGKNLIKMLKTKSGHEIVLDDTDDKGKIKISSSAGYNINLDDENKEITIKDPKGKNKIEVSTSGGNVNVNAEKKIVLKAGGASITIDGTANKIVLKANTIEGSGLQVKLKGSTTVKIESGAALDLKAGAIAQIKGNPVKIN